MILTFHSGVTALKMETQKRWITVFLCMAIFPVVASPFGPKIDAIIQQGIDQTVMMQFEEALSTFTTLDSLMPRHFIGTFYKAATYQSMMMDYESRRWEDNFFTTIQKTITTGDSLITAADSIAPWDWFYLGSAYIYKGLQKAKTGALISGFRNAHKGIGYLEQAVEKDTTLYEAYLGIGSYKYWAGRYSKYLKWLPFFSDERDKGLQMLRQSVKKSTFSYWVALTSLGWIEYDRENYEQSIACFSKGLDRYPGSRFFLWGLASCYFRLEAWDKAIAVYHQLLQSIAKAPVNNKYNEMECRWKLMQCYDALNNNQEVLAQADLILNTPVSIEICDRLNEHYQDARTYRKKALKQLNP